MKKIDQILECHPLAQFVVLEAIRRYSEQVAQSSPEDYPEHWLFAPESWIQSGKDIHKIFLD
jgi:hypothetical protein